MSAQEVRLAHCNSCKSGKLTKYTKEQVYINDKKKDLSENFKLAKNANPKLNKYYYDWSWSQGIIHYRACEDCIGEYKKEFTYHHNGVPGSRDPPCVVQ